MKLAIFVLTFILVAEAFGSDIHAKWESHKQKHNKTYHSTEHEALSKEKFMRVDKMIEEHNRQAAAGNVSYTVAHNHFSDDISENQHKHKGFILPDAKGKRAGQLPVRNYVSSGVQIPRSFDWRQQGWDVPVRNQGICGCCWSFTITASMEAQIFKKARRIVTLSPQELIDCSSRYGTNGCHGAVVPRGFQYVYDNGVTEDEILPYEYENQENNDRRCPAGIQQARRYRISGLTQVQFGDVNSLREAIVTRGPLAIGIDSRLQSFKNYKGGLYDGSEMYNNQRTGQRCSSNADHAVLLIGYGVTQDNRRYWIIKNQWGADNWGDNGYMYMLDNGSDMCGITVQALVPDVV